ncbi:M20 family metallopeptidase [Agromyces humatus]|uniref:M20 family metallopeptidase n=1 Tax=Agromyces humatus TaxID=279573 RepID=A0ABN2KT55_9MICO|nr:M20 family metallopeptidase [Agromyces humatus]
MRLDLRRAEHVDSPSWPAAPSWSPSLLRAAAQAATAQYRADLAELVSIDSGSTDADGVNRVADWCAARLAGDGFSVSRLRTEPVGGTSYGDVVVARRHGNGTERVLLFAHMDTVFPTGEAARRPYRESGGRAYGPGVSDDKGGLLAGIAAARALDACGLRGYGELVIALTPDEEVGSPASRSHLAALARESDFALSLECARENGDLVSARKGIADIRVEITGRAAHSGIEPERGANAAAEAAHLVLDLLELNGSRPDVTVNVGTVAAGTRPNIVPDFAELSLEVRAARLDDLEAVFADIDERAAKVKVPGTTIRTTRHDVCPPLESAATARLAAAASSIADRLGFEVRASATGGASDANFVAACGVPTLDGLGPIGGDDHSAAEWLDLESVPSRVALLAALIADLADPATALRWDLVRGSDDDE